MSDNRFKYIKTAGILDVEKLRADGLYPSDERIARGPVAVFECAQEIPCNPCEKACPKGCILIGEHIVSIPHLKGACSGCGLCVPSCPGLCIFILNGTFSETEAAITMPYEFMPIPVKDEIVDALDRSGARACDGRIVSVKTVGKNEVCRSLTVAVPKRFIHTVRHVRRKIS